MTPGIELQEDPGSAPSFRAVLRPSRSLSPRGFVILLTGLSVLSSAVGVVFAAMGAWPVAGFFGLDVALLALAFHLNARAGRESETIEITARALTLTRRLPNGRLEQASLNPYWARVDLGADRGSRGGLVFRLHDERIAFARFLPPHECRDLALILRRALREARGGRRV